MYNQAAKAYARINALVEKEQPKPVKSTGLLGRLTPKKKEQEKEAEPQDRVVEMVRDLRKARMELKNGK